MPSVDDGGYATPPSWEEFVEMTQQALHETLIDNLWGVAGRKELAEECDARLEHGMAVWAERRGALLELREHRLGALGPETVEALCKANGAVHLDDGAAAGARVERVDVLCDDRGDEASPLELGERPVCHVRFCVEEQVDPPAVEVPHPLGIAPKGLNGRDFEGVDVGPDPGR